MDTWIAKCGCDCAGCPTYKKNIETPEQRNRCSRAWKQYWNIRLSPEKLRPCDGCQTPDEQNPTRYLNCRVRKCAVHSGVENCAYCSAYPCDEVMTIHEGQAGGIREKIEKRSGAAIPEEDYAAFIEPYEGIKHLNRIRESIGGGFVEPALFDLKHKIVGFPEALGLDKTETDAYRSLHRLLSRILQPVQGITYAHREALKKRVPYYMMLLWTLGLYGIYREEGGGSLTADSIEFSSQKTGVPYAWPYSRIEERLKRFRNYGVICQIHPLVETGWLTPSGGLRTKAGRKDEPAWELKMSFDRSAGGAAGLTALQAYAARLADKYGDGGFKLLRVADFRIFG